MGVLFLQLVVQDVLDSRLPVLVDCLLVGGLRPWAFLIDAVGIVGLEDWVPYSGRAGDDKSGTWSTRVLSMMRWKLLVSSARLLAERPLAPRERVVVIIGKSSSLSRLLIRIPMGIDMGDAERVRSVSDWYRPVPPSSDG
jgi:hypothetical protein